jgi:hypothetical protein
VAHALNRRIMHRFLKIHFHYHDALILSSKNSNKKPFHPSPGRKGDTIFSWFHPKFVFLSSRRLWNNQSYANH